MCDDSRVTDVSNEKSVVTADAYLLFYRRRDCSALIGGPSPSNKTTAAPNQQHSIDMILPPSEPHPLSMSNSKSKVSFSSSNQVFEDNGGTSGMRHFVDLPAPQNRNDSGLERGDVELMEKQDKEKDTNVCDIGATSSKCNEQMRINDCDITDENYVDQNVLVIDAPPDLGYTDMEAVD